MINNIKLKYGEGQCEIEVNPTAIQKENFVKFEKKLINVISQCNEGNIVDKLEYLDDKVNTLKIKNANSLEHYEVDGIHVYKFLNTQRQTINYWFTTKPIFAKTKMEYTYRGFVAINDSYGLEYSMGGLGNGIGGSKNNNYDFYANNKHIAFIQPAFTPAGSSGDEFQKGAISISGVLTIYVNDERELLRRLSILFGEGKATSIVYSGNMEEIIESQIISKNQHSCVYDRQEQLQDLLRKINELSLKADEKRISEKRNKLLGLLQRNKDLNAKLANVFGETQSQKIGR